MNDKTYDILSKVQRWLPALAVFYVTLATIWQLPFGDEISKTINAIAALLAATLEISTVVYQRKLKVQENEDQGNN